MLSFSLITSGDAKRGILGNEWAFFKCFHFVRPSEMSAGFDRGWPSEFSALGVHGSPCCQSISEKFKGPGMRQVPIISKRLFPDISQVFDLPGAMFLRDFGIF